MCGIAGLIFFDGRPVHEPSLRAMSNAMRHRGPDDEGLWVNKNVGVANRRLAIIDVETGRQPLTEDGIVVVFNGEIYNFRELRAELKGAGHIFQTRSDTEVLLHGYQQWGTEMLHRLNGMFTFAIFDDRTKKLFLARDRIGVKPLYYYHNKNVFAFASDMPGLVASGWIPRDVDEEAMDLYFHYQYIPSPLSIYRNVRKLPPADYLLLDTVTGEARCAQYWALPIAQSPSRNQSLHDWVEELETLLLDCVRIRLVSDVPFGAFLSGGSDSGLVVAMMATFLENPVRTFTVGFRGSPTLDVRDERLHARYIARRVGTEHREQCVTPEGLALIPTLCRYLGEPFADSSALPTFYVSKMASTEVKMVLTGDGGDELFGGYLTYPRVAGFSPATLLFHHLARRFRPAEDQYVPGHQTIPTRWRRWLWRGERWWRHGLAAVRHLVAPWYQRHDTLMSPFSKAERERLFAKKLPVSGSDWLLTRYRFPGADSVIASAQYCDFRAYLPDDVLVKVDRMSMAHSLEVRSPLLDYRIAELAFAMPTSVKIPDRDLAGTHGKRVLKALASKYLGAEHVYRPKQGFGVPVGNWLRDKFDEYLHETLLRGSSPIYRYIQRNVVEDIVRRHVAGLQDCSAKLWCLLMFDGWLRYVHTMPTLT